MLVNFTGFLFVACTLNNLGFIEVRSRGGEGPGGRGQMGGGMLVLCPDPTQPMQGELAGWESGHKTI